MWGKVAGEGGAASSSPSSTLPLRVLLLLLLILVVDNVVNLLKDLLGGFDWFLGERKKIKNGKINTDLLTFLKVSYRKS